MDKKFNPQVAEEARAHIGNFIRERRKELNLSQKQLGEMAQVRRATVSKAENGEPIMLDILLALLGCMRIKILFETMDPNSVPGIPMPTEN